MEVKKFMTADMLAVKEHFENFIEKDFLFALNQYKQAKKAASISLPHLNENGIPVNYAARREIKVIQDYWYDRMGLLLHYFEKDFLEKHNYYNIIK